MARILFSNNATSRLRIAIPAGSSTITVDEGHGAKFPQPEDGSGDFFMVTLDDRRTGQIEICKAVGRSGDILQVVRAQEGTVAQDFLPGAVASNRITSGTLDWFQTLAESAGGYTKFEADDRYINVAGDTMAGPLILPEVMPGTDREAAHKAYVDEQRDTRAPTQHSHPIDDIVDLQQELDGKADTIHSHEIEQVNGLASELSNLQSGIDANDLTMTAEIQARINGDIAEADARNAAIAAQAAATSAQAMGDALALAIALG